MQNPAQLLCQIIHPLKVSRLILFLIVVIGSTIWPLQAHSGSRPQLSKRDVPHMTTQQLADEGEKIIFGKQGGSKASFAVGRGQCPLCHNFQKSNAPSDLRAPNLFGIIKRAPERLKDPRYHLGKPQDRDTIQKEAYPGSGTATTGLEYIAESLVCPSCYVVAGYGVRGTNDTESPGVMLHKPPVSLNVSDLVAVTTWLYIREGVAPPPPPEIENAYKKFIPAVEWGTLLEKPIAFDINLFVRGNQPVSDIFAKARCLDCHYIAGIEGAKPEIGLSLGRQSFVKRMNDPTRKGNYLSINESVKASILDPQLHHWVDYGNILSEKALNRMVEYLSAVDID